MPPVVSHQIGVEQRIAAGAAQLAKRPVDADDAVRSSGCVDESRHHRDAGGESQARQLRQPIDSTDNPS